MNLPWRPTVTMRCLSSLRAKSSGFACLRSILGLATITATMRAPSSTGTRLRRVVSTSGSSGTAQDPLYRTAAISAAACSAFFLEVPSPVATTSPPTHSVAVNTLA